MSGSARSNRTSSAYGPRFISFLIITPLIIAALVQPLLSRSAPVRNVSSSLVISQIYGGGGNSGATLKNDYIELFNPGNASVDISGWSVQYTSANGANSWQVTPLCPSGGCTLGGGQYFLVQEAQGAGGTTSLPSPDAIGTVAMSATAGKVALVSNTTALVGSCPLTAVDLVGYGAANCFEGSGAASSPGNTSAVFRNSNGCLDSNNNSSDFALGTPRPRNITTPATACGVSPSPTATPTPSATPDCGVERWSIKTGTDGDAAIVDLNSTLSTTIGTMRSWPAPAPIPSNNRVSNYETTVWVINGTLTKYKLEDDSDYHLVISDDAGNTIITEIPHPGCVGATSPFKAGITNARAQFDARFTATTSFQTSSVAVQLKGVGMFDFQHGQTGVAPNGIELHPVIDITFPTATPSPSPTPQLQLLLEQSGPNVNQAAALDSVIFLRDPFPIDNRSNVLRSGADPNTRIVMTPGEPAPLVMVNLTDSSNQSFDVAAEDVRVVPGVAFTQVVFRLPASLALGACTIKISAQGQISNSGVIRIRS
jgi:hypothetical protein